MHGSILHWLCLKQDIAPPKKWHIFIAGQATHTLRPPSSKPPAAQPVVTHAPIAPKAPANSRARPLQKAKPSLLNTTQGSQGNGAQSSTRDSSRFQPPQLHVPAAIDATFSLGSNSSIQPGKGVQPPTPTSPSTAVGESPTGAAGHSATALSNGPPMAASGLPMRAGGLPATALSNGPPTAEGTPALRAEGQLAPALGNGPQLDVAQEPPLRKSRTPERRKGAIAWQQGPSLRDSLESAFTSIPLFSPDPMHKGTPPTLPRPPHEGHAGIIFRRNHCLCFCVALR